MLGDVAQSHKLGAKRMEGEAAIYGPKLDFMFKDALGRETQLATIQLDFAMPKRFGLEYTAEDGTQQPPVMIHRAILGSFERFIMLLIEHFAGAFPLWLAPEQVRILPISDKVSEYAKATLQVCKEKGLRVTLDDSSESLGKKIRNAELMKTPYTLIVGEKEAANGTVSVRRYGEGDLGAQKIDDLITTLLEKVADRSID
jgi:threonyl-tRNA synthetase